MSSRLFVPLVLSAALALTAAPALAAPTADEPVELRVTLPVDLKDPFVAYSLGLVPFGGPWAAAYVGTSRVQGSPGPTHLLTGWAYNAIDLGVLAGIAVLAAQPVTPGSSPSLLPYLAVAALPLAHMAWFGPYWGGEAARFNRDAVLKAGFKRHSTIEPYRPERSWVEAQ